jgi:hypothetical protein
LPLSPKLHGCVFWGYADVFQIGAKLSKRMQLNKYFSSWRLEPESIDGTLEQEWVTSFWIVTEHGERFRMDLNEAIDFFEAVSEMYDHSRSSLGRIVATIRKAQRDSDGKMYRVVRCLAAAHQVIADSKRYQRVRSSDAMLARIIIEQAIEILAGGVRVELVLADLAADATQIVDETRRKIKGRKEDQTLRAPATT